MATVTTCDCGRRECKGMVIPNPNAALEGVEIRAKGHRFKVAVLPAPGGGHPDLRPSCIVELLRDGELAHFLDDGSVLEIRRTP